MQGFAIEVRLSSVRVAVAHLDAGEYRDPKAQAEGFLETPLLYEAVAQRAPSEGAVPMRAP